MRTEELVAQLARDVRPVSRHSATVRLYLGLLIGAITAFSLLLIGPGLRPDIAAASATVPFWMKWAFTLSLMCSGIVIVRRLGDPTGRVGLAWLGLAVPIAVVAIMALTEIFSAQSPPSTALVLGNTASRCLAAIVILSIPTLIGTLWAFRRLAPVHLRLAGAAIGVLSGATGAAVYAFACQETSAAFMVTWYSIGIVASGLLGIIIGPRLLRW